MEKAKTEPLTGKERFAIFGFVIWVAFGSWMLYRISTSAAPLVDVPQPPPNPVIRIFDPVRPKPSEWEMFPMPFPTRFYVTRGAFIRSEISSADVVANQKADLHDAVDAFFASVVDAAVQFYSPRVWIRTFQAYFAMLWTIGVYGSMELAMRTGPASSSVTNMRIALAGLVTDAGLTPVRFCYNYFWLTLFIFFVVSPMLSAILREWWYRRPVADLWFIRPFVKIYPIAMDAMIKWAMSVKADWKAAVAQVDAMNLAALKKGHEAALVEAAEKKKAYEEALAKTKACETEAFKVE